MEVMETLEGVGRAVELFGLLGDTLKDTATLQPKEEKGALIPYVAVAIPAILRGTTTVVGVVGDTFVTFHPTT